jgi:aminoglycoside phosphotransferase (APT) family kinase protein
MIPNSIEEVTPDWLTEALGEGRPGVVIRGVKIDRAIHGTSSKWFVTVDRNDAAIAAGIPEGLCLKVNWEDHAGETLKKVAIWCTEGRFYRYLRPHLPVPAPEGYYGAFDDATGQGICIMEDLTAAGAVFGSNGRPLTADQAAAVLEDLTDLHAAWWNSPKLEEFDWLKPSFGVNNYRNRYADAKALGELTTWPGRAETMSPAVNNPELWLKAVDRIVETENASTAPRCLIHGDTHLGNSYTLPNHKLRWLDWQLVSKGRPTRELNYFLGCALDTPTRRANERDLIKHYLSVLQAKGVEGGPTFDEVWANYRYWPIWGLLAWAVTKDGWQPPDVIRETMRRFATAIEDLETFKDL